MGLNQVDGSRFRRIRLVTEAAFDGAWGHRSVARGEGGRRLAPFRYVWLDVSLGATEECVCTELKGCGKWCEFPMRCTVAHFARFGQCFLEAKAGVGVTQKICRCTLGPLAIPSSINAWRRDL